MKERVFTNGHVIWADPIVKDYHYAESKEVQFWSGIKRRKGLPLTPGKKRERPSAHIYVREMNSHSGDRLILVQEKYLKLFPYATAYELRRSKFGEREFEIVAVLCGKHLVGAIMPVMDLSGDVEVPR